MNREQCMPFPNTDRSKSVAKVFLYCTLKYYFISGGKNKFAFYLFLYIEFNQVLLNYGPEITNTLDSCSFPLNVLILSYVTCIISGGLIHQICLHSFSISLTVQIYLIWEKIYIFYV